MRTHFAISAVLPCTLMILGLGDALAQSPPHAEQDALVWSNQDRSLRVDGFAASPETETTLRLPQIDFPAGNFDGRQGRVLVCEPGQFGFAASAAAAYAQAGKP